MKNNRNAQIVGNNSKSYNDKHPDNPIHLRPIRQAIANLPKVKDDKGQLHPDYKAIRELRSFGSVAHIGKQHLETLARKGSA
jgi:hypothetical protein